MATGPWQEPRRQNFATTNLIQDCTGSESESVVPLTVHVDGVRVFKSAGGCKVVYNASNALVKTTSLKCKYTLTVIQLQSSVKDTSPFVTVYMCYLLRALKSGLGPQMKYNANASET